MYTNLTCFAAIRNRPNKFLLKSNFPAAYLSFLISLEFGTNMKTAATIAMQTKAKSNNQRTAICDVRKESDRERGRDRAKSEIDTGRRSFLACLSSKNLCFCSFISFFYSLFQFCFCFFFAIPASSASFMVCDKTPHLRSMSMR